MLRRSSYMHYRTDPDLQDTNTSIAQPAYWTLLAAQVFILLIRLYPS